MNHSPSSLSRRRILAGMAGVGAVGLVGCGPTSGPTGNSSTTPSAAPAALELPNFVPYEGAAPDLPALDNGTSAYFKTVPSELATYLDGPPGDGSEVSVFSIVNAPVVPLERNPRWQSLNAMLGATVTLTGATTADFASKFQTMVAGNSLPDISCVLPTITPQMKGMLDATFTDLTEYLAGDAITDYPALANIPTYNWKGSVFGQNLYLIPAPRLALFRAYLVRADMAEAAGVNPQPSDGAELLDLMAGLTDTRRNRFATTAWEGTLDMVNEMMGTPNNWAEEGGSFTKDFESESYADALDVVASMWKKGYFHPDSFSANIKSNVNTMYAGGQVPFLPATPVWAQLAADAKASSDHARTAAIALPTWTESSAPVQRWLSAGTPYRVGIPRTDPDRVKMLLSIIDALAAPFGTTEFVEIKYGVEGTDYTMNDGAVVPTEEGAANRVLPLIYAGAPALVHNHPDADAARDEYEQEKMDMDHVVEQAHVGLESPIDQKDGAALTAQIMDVVGGVIRGSKSMADWTEAVAEWRKNGGEQIRGEYEAAFAEANG